MGNKAASAIMGPIGVMLGHQWGAELGTSGGMWATGGKMNDKGEWEGGNKDVARATGAITGTAMDLAFGLPGVLTGMAVDTVGSPFDWMGGNVGGVMGSAGAMARGETHGINAQDNQGIFGNILTEIMGTALDVGRVSSGKYNNEALGGAVDREMLTTGTSKALFDTGASLQPAVDGFVKSINDGTTTVGNGFKGIGDAIINSVNAGIAGVSTLGTLIIDNVTNGLAGVVGLGTTIYNYILDAIKGIPVVGGLVSTAENVAATAGSTVKSLVGNIVPGAADGGIIAATGYIEAHAGEVIGNINDVKSAVSNTSSTSSGSTISINIPITVYGSSSSVASDIKKELESYLPQLLRKYNVASQGI
jgi:hypothetical protein